MRQDSDKESSEAQDETPESRYDDESGRVLRCSTTSDLVLEHRIWTRASFTIASTVRIPKPSGLELLKLMDASEASDEALTRHAYIVMTAESMLDADAATLLARRAIPLMEKICTMDELLDQVARAASRLARGEA
jgi:hypothetical protein